SLTVGGGGTFTAIRSSGIACALPAVAAVEVGGCDAATGFSAGLGLDRTGASETSALLSSGTACGLLVAETAAGAGAGALSAGRAGDAGPPVAGRSPRAASRPLAADAGRAIVATSCSVVGADGPAADLLGAAACSSTPGAAPVTLGVG